MNECLGGVIIPYFKELLNDRDAAAVHPAAVKIEAAAERLQSGVPQALIVLAPHGAEIEDAVSVHSQPRLRGSFVDGQGNEQVLGFEMEHALTKAILQQSERLGIPMQEVTEELRAQYYWRDGLTSEAFVPLYYLHKAGFKKQIVHLNYGNLPYEEMYTLGKAVQLAMHQVGKKTAILAAAGLAAVGQESERAWNHALIEVLAKRDVKSLLVLAGSKPEGMESADLRALFFFLGGLSKMEFGRQEVYYEEYAGKGQVIGVFM